MARGWESKDVASQQELAEERRKENQPARTDADMERASLELHRKRVMADLERARHPRHRTQIEEALRHLDERLKLLGPVTAAGPVVEPDSAKDHEENGG